MCSSSLDPKPCSEGSTGLSSSLCFSLWSTQLMSPGIKQNTVDLFSLTVLSFWFKSFSPVNVLGFFWTMFCPIKGSKLKAALAPSFSEVIWEKCYKIVLPSQIQWDSSLMSFPFFNLSSNSTPWRLSSDGLPSIKTLLTIPVHSTPRHLQEGPGCSDNVHYPLLSSYPCLLLETYMPIP